MRRRRQGAVLMRCETCKFWDSSTQLSSEPSDTTGLCRIDPPVVDKRSGHGLWPFTSDTDWCSRHQETPPAPRECTKSEDCAKPDGHDGECDYDRVPF